MAQLNLISAFDSYKSFCKDFNEVIERYPNLRVKESNGIKYFKGIVDIPDENGNIVGSFLMELHWQKGYPYRFPLLFEVGGMIPNEADWHKYSNSGCCITVEADEILICKNGIHLLEFMKKHAIGFFANFIFKNVTGNYKNGDYGHGGMEIAQFYSHLLKTNDAKLWLQYFKNVFENLAYNKDRNNLCFCNSGKKYKCCHDIVFDKLNDIGKEQVLKDFKLIFQY